MVARRQRGLVAIQLAMAAVEFTVNPQPDIRALATIFRRQGRLQIPSFLEPGCAQALLEYLQAEQRWTRVFNQGDKLFELSRDVQASMSSEQTELLELAVLKGARHGFQFRFENIRVSDNPQARAASGGLLEAFASFMSSPPVLEQLRLITGEEDVTHADAQATAYSPGDFLTAHDDEVDGKGRRAAYVLGLSPGWLGDWGGLLLFHGRDGRIADAFVPAFNTLTLFAVPQPHSVSAVAPFAPRRRYSVTGWLRAL
jgi:Rps23 Pro-64 3,4-dihydroxylase Tpa1-like proline 4-hydroxylase